MSDPPTGWPHDHGPTNVRAMVKTFGVNVHCTLHTSFVDVSNALALLDPTFKLHQGGCCATVTCGVNRHYKCNFLTQA